jgi:hypothetical protein
MDLICMHPSHVPDPACLLWKEGGGKNEIDVTSSKVTGLSQVLELFNIRFWVSGERAKVLFYLREVSEGEGDMDPHNAFCSGHFLERVDGNWLTGGVCESKSVCGSRDPVVLGGRRGGRSGRGKGRRRGEGKGRRRGRGKDRRRGRARAGGAEGGAGADG